MERERHTQSDGSEMEREGFERVREKEEEMGRVSYGGTVTSVTLILPSTIIRAPDFLSTTSATRLSVYRVPTPEMA